MMTQHTFVICAYGDSDYLEPCLQSLTSQTFPSNLLIYTSTPSTFIEDIAERYDISIVTAEGGGIGKDWNNALSFVKTPYATIAHQDDVYLPDFTQQVMAAFEKHPNSSIVFTDYAELQDDQLRPANINLKIKTLMLRVMDWLPAHRFWRQRVLAFGNPICCPAVTYNRSLLTGFQFSEELKTSLDWHAWYVISRQYKGRFTYVKDKLMHHRIHEASETTATIADKTRTKEDLMMYECFWPKWIAQCLIKWYEKSQISND